MNNYKSIRTRILGIFQSLLTPVISEFPFFALFLFAIAVMPLRFFPSPLLHGYFEATKDFLWANFPRAGAIAYLFTLVVYHARSRILRIGGYAFAALMFTVVLFLHFVFRKQLQPDVILLIGETNPSESQEFLSSFLFSPGGICTLLCLVAYVAVVCFLDRRRERIANKWMHLKCRPVLNVMMSGFVLLGFYQFRLFGDIISHKNVDEIKMWRGGNPDAVSSLCYSLYCVHLVHEEMKRAVEVTKATHVVPQKFSTDSLNLIYVIGESYIKSHSHLYGYNLPTTPYLDEERRKGNLFVFEDVITASNQTSVTMKNTLCCNSLRNGEKWYDKPYFPSIFKKAGYDVLLWDSQYTGNQAIYEFSLQSFMYNRQLCEQSYTQTSQRIFQYDGETLDDFSRGAKGSKSHRLVLFHLIGQHIDAASRYPHEQPYEKFKANDIRWNKPYLTDAKRQKVAEYDNATLYNDSILKRIIDLYRDKNTVILYFSDHGEEVYDYRDSQGRADSTPSI